MREIMKHSTKASLILFSISVSLLVIALFSFLFIAADGTYEEEEEEENSLEEFAKGLGENTLILVVLGSSYIVYMKGRRLIRKAMQNRESAFYKNRVYPILFSKRLKDLLYYAHILIMSVAFAIGTFHAVTLFIFMQEIQIWITGAITWLFFLFLTTTGYILWLKPKFIRDRKGIYRFVRARHTQLIFAIFFYISLFIHREIS